MVFERLDDGEGEEEDTTKEKRRKKRLMSCFGRLMRYIRKYIE